MEKLCIPSLCCKGYMEEGDFTEQAGEIGGGSSGGSNNQSESNDPTNEKPTDETIKVKITDISYNFVKKDGVVNAYTEIKGITNGVDHVSLCYVIYYKDGTYDVQ
ncbi:MAG: hypothetical protein J7K95_00500 [Thermoplasmata archaeon]|nr:hypothetical protein [Thermoplasmata archaeon]